ncbi:hypothetical protein [Prosthecobacter sp.]|uniref:hypothetical protein n=1 Tax=Prosthecobacter sp. TaxID=1965333 RepID=UPI002489DEFB|nr:hypothetical protein [Prosthecobacter sp.]MDI1312212.1 hypothetical protein [Prosthecobacter sp.]
MGNKSRGIFAQSTGGGGGTGGSASGLVSIGGAGSNRGSASTVTVSNLSTGIIQTQGLYADAIFAQSIGGGGDGGDGGSTLGMVSVGGNAGLAENGGGAGGKVTVTNGGSIITLGEDSLGIHAQSVGGSGGSAGSFGLFAGVAVGDYRRPRWQRRDRGECGSGQSNGEQ